MNLVMGIGAVGPWTTVVIHQCLEAALKVRFNMLQQKICLAIDRPVAQYCHSNIHSACTILSYAINCCRMSPSVIFIHIFASQGLSFVAMQINSALIVSSQGSVYDSSSQSYRLQSPLWRFQAALNDFPTSLPSMVMKHCNSAVAHQATQESDRT